MKKTWIITGTSSGFGKEMSILLAKKNEVNLVATARNTSSLDYLDEFDKGQIKKIKLDVVNQEDINNVVKETIDTFGSIDVLVNNAGLGYFGTFEESDRETVNYMMDVNFWGLIDTTRAVLPQMRKQKSGTIINIASVGGLCSFPTVSFYNATKYAVEGISEALAKELEPLNIKVMVVEPGAFRTNWAGNSSSKKYPEIEDYEHLKLFMGALEKNAGHEAGDPKKAVEIIYEQVQNNYENLPLHLLLGKAASDIAIEKFENLSKKFKEMKELSVSADQPE